MPQCRFVEHNTATYSSIEPAASYSAAMQLQQGLPGIRAAAIYGCSPEYSLCYFVDELRLCPPCSVGSLGSLPPMSEWERQGIPFPGAMQPPGGASAAGVDH
jgi:hypothetical protein